MRNTRIYTEQALQSRASFVLAPEPSRHIARSLRMEVGAALTLFDGRGGEYPAIIDAIDKKHVTVTTGEHDAVERESVLDVHLGIALSRGDRFDWVIQKATELGVRRITPLDTEHTGVRLKGDRLEKKLGHWQQVAVSACEQCGRNRLPAIGNVTTVAQWLGTNNAELSFVLHHRAADVPALPDTAKDIALLIGPEGGLSASEIAAAEDAGFNALSLGPRVLRTETAPLAALALLQARWGDMQLP